ncbi:MAG: hypothetical protein A3F84_02175 [Candidatus Handelsmanbacteria bacterium RIFCSPLOWO2_12_FULL_64_10]|uniref:Amidase domain-containing protein n=1 Tax=Handelsmanbacteria sp. (strain RIFCSPLOWO2_12_FULL_64_10) TaxID=1817868 RepID=A0A1F6D764_HANXR|nr:MAG: hypothetical protein A3F84_02175 [Candidatus Handelsmanbacteria bacterium RIFCSPLOWO2_12_FULL_64_10]
MPSRDLHFLTIAELVPLLRRREVSPVELTEAFLGRIARHDGKLRSYITVTADRARADAKAAETALMAGNDLGPLHGIPVALKDLCDTAGIRTTSGSKIRADHVPQRSSTVAVKLAQAGAVLLGKTNMVEFAFGPYGLNPHYGVPANPWDPERVPGGSSSGSGVAVAAGLATAAIGTDTGGSVRIPAAYCGIVGLKPTAGRVSAAGCTPLSWTLDSVGPMTRGVEDAALVHAAIAGPDPEDPPTLSQPIGDALRALKQGVRGMRVGLVRRPFFEGADPEVAAAVERAADLLSGLGVRVEETAFPEAQVFVESHEILFLSRVEGYAYHRRTLAERGGDYDPQVRERLQAGAAVSAADYVLMLRERDRLMRSAQETLRSTDAVLGPTMLTPAPKVKDVQSGIPSRLTTRIVNFLGLCAISVPCGFTSEGLPVGLQLIGKPFDEATVLRLAHAYEQAAEWRLRRPAL